VCEALKVGIPNREKRVVFFGVGFEPTARANAMAVWQARRLGLRNFFLLCSHVTVPPVISAILQAPQNKVNAFLAPGHVCAVMGWREYEPISSHYQVPIVVTGFEPLDLLEGIVRCAKQLESGEAKLENQYGRAVNRLGNQG